MLRDRTIERILQEEPDEAKAQELIDKLTKIKEDIDKYIADNYEEE